MKSEIDYKELITRFLGKNLNEAELTLLTDWINESYTNRKIFDQYNELWQMSSVILDERHFNTDTGWDSLHQEMKKSGPAYNSDIQLIKNNHLSLWRITSVAAMLIAALFIGLFFEKTSKSDNKQLGLDLAESVRNFLRSAGLQLHSMSVISYGSTQPVAAGKDRKAQAQNRRVVLMVLV